jgi:hypothetical protein
MKAIESIKAQISAIIVFTAKDFTELEQQEKTSCERIVDAVKRMKDAKVFTESEIKEIHRYAIYTRNTRSNECWRDIRAAMRANFEF